MVTMTEQTEWFIDGVIPQTGITTIIGPRFSGKSWLVEDIALYSASGREWGGRATRKAHILFVCPNHLRSFAHRLRGWELYHDAICPDDSLKVVTRDEWPINDDGSVNEIGAQILQHTKCTAIVIDSFSELYSVYADYSEIQVMHALQPLIDVARQWHVPIILTQPTDLPLQETMTRTLMARSEVVYRMDGKDPFTCVCVKSRIGHAAPITFTVQTVKLDDDKNHVPSGVVIVR